MILFYVFMHMYTHIRTLVEVKMRRHVKKNIQILMWTTVPPAIQIGFQPGFFLHTVRGAYIVLKSPHKLDIYSTCVCVAVVLTSANIRFSSAALGNNAWQPSLLP